jgi:hypothetical protein
MRIKSVTGGSVIGTLVEQRSLLPLDEVAVSTTRLTHLLSTYAMPGAFANLLASVRRGTPIVVFSLPEGAGRTTHAEALAAHVAGLASHVAEPVFGPAPPPSRLEISRLMFGGSPHFPHKRLPPGRHHVWLLEVPTDEEDFEVASTFGDCFPALERQLREQDCWLFVLTRPDQWRRIGVSSSGHCVFADPHLRGVTATQIAHAHLEGEKPDIDIEGWLGDPGIQQLITGPPAIVLEVVGSILAAERTPLELLPTDTSARSQDPLAIRIAMVLDSRGQWRQQLLAWHRQPGRSAFERDFQLTAAVMTGLPVAHIYHGASNLNSDFGGARSTDVGGQAAPGVIQMVDAIRGELTPNNRVEFPRPGWADAILEYFWLDRPLARATFITWLASAPTFTTGDAMEAVSEEQRKAVARRIVRFALRWGARQNRETPLERLASDWYPPKRHYLWQELVAVLSTIAAAQDADPDEVGADLAPLVEHRSYVHRLLLSWAKSTNAELTHVVLAVCTGPFTNRFTSKALVRLKHAGRHLDEQARPLLEQVIAQLWAEPSARTPLLGEIATWCDSEAHRRAGCAAFSRLAGLVASRPEAEFDGGLALLQHTTGYTPDLEVLSRCWRASLDLAEDPNCDALLTAWLDAAVADHDQHDDVLTVLRHAARGNTAAERATRDRVRGIARHWAARADVRKPLYHALTEAFDADLTHAATGFLGNPPRFEPATPEPAAPGGQPS